MTNTKPFWQVKSLTEMTPGEWDSLCDGCGKCCLEKLEDILTAEISYTDVACPLLNVETCRCKKYEKRKQHMPDCIQLNPDTIGELKWMPSTCAYRLLSEGSGLPEWHPLITGDRQSVIDAGVSVKGRVVKGIEAGDLEDHIVTWPE